MKKTVKSFLIGALIAATATAVVPSYGKEAAEQITAVYRNIKLVVDGVTVEPKDANGDLVEPFIYNGTTYLPVRAVATAFGKEVSWDGDNAVVYLGEVVDKPAKQLELWNRPYIECDSTSRIETYQGKNSGKGYLYCSQSKDEKQADGKYHSSNSITYPLNALAKTVTGTYYLDGADSAEGTLKILNSNGKVLYQSPIMRDVTKEVDFEVNVENEIAVTFVFERRANSSLDAVAHYVENPIIVSSDY